MPTAFVSVDTRAKSYVPDAMIACDSYLNGTPTVTGTPATGQVLNSTIGETPRVLKVTSSTSAWLMTDNASGTYARSITIGANSVSASARSTMSASAFSGGSQVHSSGKILLHGWSSNQGQLTCGDLSAGTVGPTTNFITLGATVNPCWNQYYVMLTSSLALVLPNGNWSGTRAYAYGRTMYTLSLSGTTITSVDPLPAGAGFPVLDTDTNWSTYRTDVVAAYRVDSTRAIVFYFGLPGTDVSGTPIVGVAELRARIVTVSGAGVMSLGTELVINASALDTSRHEGSIGTPFQDHHWHSSGSQFEGLPSVNLDGTFSFCTRATVSGQLGYWRFTVSVSGTTCSLASTEQLDSPYTWGPFRMVETDTGKYVGYFSTKTQSFGVTDGSNENHCLPWGSSRPIGGFGEFDMGASPKTNRANPRTAWSRDTVHMSRSMVGAHTRPSVASHVGASQDPRIPYSPPGGTYSLDEASYVSAVSGLLAAVLGRTDTALQVAFSPSKVGATAEHDIHVALMRTQTRVRPAGAVELRAYNIQPWQAKKMATDYVDYYGTYAKMPTPSYTVVASQSRAQFNPDWIEAYNTLPKFLGGYNDWNGWRDLSACVSDTIRYKGFNAGQNMFTATPSYDSTRTSKDAAYANATALYDRFPARPGDLVVANQSVIANKAVLRFYDKDGVIIGGTRDSACVAPALTCSFWYAANATPFGDDVKADITVTPQTADVFTGDVSTSKTRLIYAGPRAAGSNQLITVADPGSPGSALETHAVAAGEYVLSVHSERATNHCWWLTISSTHLNWYRTAEGSGLAVLRYAVAIGSALHTSMGGVPFSWFGWTSPTDPAKGYVFFNKISSGDVFYIYPGATAATTTATYPETIPGISLLNQLSLSGVTPTVTDTTFGSGQPLTPYAQYAPYLFNRPAVANQFHVAESSAGTNAYHGYPSNVLTAYRTVGTTRADSDTNAVGQYTYWLFPSSHLGTWNYEAKAQFNWNRTNVNYETATMTIIGDLKGFGHHVAAKKAGQLRQFHGRDLIRNDGADAPAKTIRQGPHGNYQ